MRLSSARTPPRVPNLAVVLQVLLLCSSSAWLTKVITPARSNARSLGESWAGRGAAVEKEVAPTSGSGTLGLARCRGRRVGIVGGGFACPAKPKGTGAGDDDFDDGQGVCASCCTMVLTNSFSRRRWACQLAERRTQGAWTSSQESPCHPSCQKAPNYVWSFLLELCYCGLLRLVRRKSHRPTGRFMN